jgi:ribonucleoside-triphosphate reductase
MELDGIGSQLDIAAFSKKFFSKKEKLTTADVSVDSNSNVDNIDIIQYQIEVSKPLHRLNSYYLLWKYTEELFGEEKAKRILEAQFTKELYINDFYNFNMPYCFNYSCMDVVYEGLPFVKKIKSRPPKHLSSFIGQLVQFVIYTSNSSIGAIGLADFLIACSYFVEKMVTYSDDKSALYVENKFKQQVWNEIREEIKQELQSFIFSINQPSRNATQSPFTNISIFDKIFLTKLCNEYIFPDGSKPKIEIVEKLQELFVDLMNEILGETPVTFPITTACFSIDENKNILDEKFLNFIVEKNIKFGFMNIYAGKTSTLSSCCRLRSETENEYFNMFGSGGTKIGSIGVVTLNLPRIAYEIKKKYEEQYKLNKSEPEDKEVKQEFLNKLEELVILASQINHVKRYIIKKRIDNGYAPLYTLGIMVLNRQYSTCGLVGINEVVEILGMNILEKEGQAFIIELLKKINEVSDKQQKKYNSPHNIEQVPAESSAIVLANSDKILDYNKKYPFYSNQFIPLTSKADLLDRIKLQGLFDSYLSGGAICHLNFSERITDKEFLKNILIESIKQGVVYQAINYNIQRCVQEHMIVGKSEKCPICGKKIIDNFTRVVGFLVNTKNWAKTRRELDFPNRQWYGKDEKGI